MKTKILFATAVIASLFAACNKVRTPPAEDGKEYVKNVSLSIADKAMTKAGDGTYDAKTQTCAVRVASVL